MGPEIEYAEQASDPIELRIYPGADGTFSLYEDEGDSYRYEKKARATIAFTWDDRAHNLTIAAREGSFEGMANTRTFHIVLVRPQHGAGENIEARPDASIQYTGARIQLHLAK
jgi:alpha-D-xyloside xylohydrolase